jgi:hypothetical protein
MNVLFRVWHTPAAPRLTMAARQVCPSSPPSRREEWEPPGGGESGKLGEISALSIDPMPCRSRQEHTRTIAHAHTQTHILTTLSRSHQLQVEIFESERESGREQLTTTTTRRLIAKPADGFAATSWRLQPSSATRAAEPERASTVGARKRQNSFARRLDE